MEDHDDGHDQCDDVYRTGGHLKDDGIGQLDVPGIAVRLDADAVRYGCDSANRCAQRQRCRVAEGGEVAEAHIVVSWGRKATGRRRRVLANTRLLILEEGASSIGRRSVAESWGE